MIGKFCLFFFRLMVLWGVFLYSNIFTMAESSPVPLLQVITIPVEIPIVDPRCAAVIASSESLGSFRQSPLAKTAQSFWKMPSFKINLKGLLFPFSNPPEFASSKELSKGFPRLIKCISL